MNSLNYNADQLRSLPVSQKENFIKSLSKKELEFLMTDWEFWARPEQRVPTLPFTFWLILAGRAWGKTRTGAETFIEWVKDPKNKYTEMIGPTWGDVIGTMIYGPSGIQTIAPANFKPVFVHNGKMLQWPNGNLTYLFSAENPNRLRGPAAAKMWADELAAWRYPETWDMAMMGMREGENPQVVITTTPRPVQIVKDLVHDEGTYLTKGNTKDNQNNLPASYYTNLIKKYQGTRLGRQELDAEIIDDLEGALFKREWIEANRPKYGLPNKALPYLQEETVKERTFGLKHAGERSVMVDIDRIVVGVDPTATTTGDEAGIITAYLIDGEYYVMADNSTGGSVNTWATAVQTAYQNGGITADLVVAESNNGGEMVQEVIKNINPAIPTKLVWASRGKVTRAEPIAQLYEKGLVHHVGGNLAKLEDEMCNWEIGKPSPNRMDALVWAITELSSGVSLTSKKVKISKNFVYGG